MTEREWLKATDPEPMLGWPGLAPSTRKLRLFALACCARIDHLITDPRSRAALEFAERHVETAVTRQKGRKKVEKAGRAAWEDAYGKIFKLPEVERPNGLVASCAADAAVATMHTDPALGARYASSFASFAVAWGAVYAAGVKAYPDLPDRFKAPERAAQADLVRDIFGNPFRPAAVDPHWLTADVTALANSVYTEKAFDRLPILADALQDAGCEDANILKHCRDPKLAHVRGCWVVDLVLGKS